MSQPVLSKNAKSILSLETSTSQISHNIVLPDRELITLNSNKTVSPPLVKQVIDEHETKQTSTNDQTGCIVNDRVDECISTTPCDSDSDDGKKILSLINGCICLII